MHLKYLSLLALQVLAAFAATNEPCYGPNSSPGVCVSTTTCSKEGGKSYKNACPSDPSNIQCCVKSACKYSSTVTGACLWESDCGGKTVSNQCPGPAGFKCCSKPDSVFGTYKRPSIPTSNCAAVAEKGAKTLMDAWPGRVKTLYCFRSCTDKSSSDHCVGKAMDFMISDDGGDATIGGREIAEWVMDNRKKMNLKYVIWGQRIWNPSRDKVAGWPAWRSMDDEGDINKNHWNHVHVSFE